MTVAEYILIAFPALIVILNPLMAASSFMSMTMSQSDAAQLRIAKRACITALIALIVFSFAGHLIFRIFNITVEAFRIAGGIILFTIGMQMLKLQPSRIKQTEEEREEALKKTQDVGIVPLGIPILVGPGTITTVLVLTAEINWQNKLIGTLQMTGLLISSLLSTVFIYFILINSRRLIDILKTTGIGVMTRVMGLILTVIATQFVINGVKGLLPKFASLLS
ncbi:MAG: NAAT family transporter [Deltaproteobacteria bacterium]|nr:NAAT family transporter [Deltaproteobacteria bacterium]MBI4224663.1 NAAT family transporter [Deltaproteobacteria bacterium]